MFVGGFVFVVVVWFFSSSKWFGIDPNVLDFFKVLYNIHIVQITGESISLNTNKNQYRNKLD